jgi:thiamine-phosphate pyrophosphorylase
MIVLTADEGARDRLAAALQAAPVSCVVIRPPQHTAAESSTLAALVTTAQGVGAAALIADDAELAKSLDADGVHLGPGPDLADRHAAARARLGRAGIVGVDAGQSRHDAMTAGESGADYIAFGLPAPESGPPDGAAARDELVAWWAEVFEVPCVALDARDAGDARSLAESGADFVALHVRDGEAPSEVANNLRAVASAVAGIVRAR